MENWRKRWEQLTEDVAIEGYLPNGEMASDSDIEDFISEELDKAREEVLEEVLDKSRDLSMLHLAPHIPESVVKEMLSKLKDNK